MMIREVIVVNPSISPLVTVDFDGDRLVISDLTTFINLVMS